MKKLLLFFASFGSVLSLLAQTDEKEEPYLTKSLSDASIREVRLLTSGGSISVSGGSASDARIEVYITPGNRRNGNLTREEIRERLEELYDFSITAEDGRLAASARPKERDMDWKKALSISYRVYVPRQVSTELTTSGGSIRLSGLSGRQVFHTSGGSLEVIDVSGDVLGRTSGGSIRVKDAREQIDLATSGGSIEASNCTGNLRLATSGGSLRLSDLDGNISATTSGGSVHGDRIEGELKAHTSGGSVNLRDLSCSLEAGTSGGHISVSIKELGQYVRLSNSGGSIELELPRGKGVDLDLNGNRVRTGSLSNFSGSLDENEVQGKLNGGGVPVRAHAGSGRVSLSLR